MPLIALVSLSASNALAQITFHHITSHHIGVTVARVVERVGLCSEGRRFDPCPANCFVVDLVESSRKSTHPKFPGIL